MKHPFTLAIAALLLFCTLPSYAQSALNDDADSIVGTYFASHAGEDSKVSFTKSDDGTYMAQVIWCAIDKDPDGNKYLDVKNPDKSLRNTPCDQIVLIKGLKYNATKKVWNGAKIYDPTRGIKASATVKFLPNGDLSIRGTVMGIGETVVWQRL